jgi:hypothetical protein
MELDSSIIYSMVLYIIHLSFFILGVNVRYRNELLCAHLVAKILQDL